MKFVGRSFNQMLNETYHEFKNSYGLDIREHIKDICADDSIRTELIESYTRDIQSANEKAAVMALMNNAANELLWEDGITSMAKIASLSFPVIRKLWATVGLKDSLMTKVATTPSFAVIFQKPYVIDASGTKHYIVGANNLDVKAATFGKPVATRGVELDDDDPMAVLDFAASPASNSLDIGSANVADSNSSVKLQGLDLVKVSLADELGSEAGYSDTLIKKSAKVGIDGMLSIKYVDADSVEGEVIVKVDRNAAKVTVVAVGGISVAVIVDAEISQEFHETPTNVGVELTKREVQIPTGEHFSANITTESVQDMRALYSIDHVAELVSTITNLVAENLEIEIRNFLEDAIIDRATDDFEFVGSAADFTVEFDCDMQTGYLQNPNYALSASSWRSEITKTIDYVATMIVTEMHFKKGTFRVVGHPIDTMLIPNVSWEFTSADTVDGVEISYSKGVYKGAYTYQLISSPFCRKGMIGVFFIPSESERVLTYVYYPYSFNTETSGYIDRAHSRVPSIMVTKRHTIEKFMPASGAVIIKNNSPIHTTVRPPVNGDSGGESDEEEEE